MAAVNHYIPALEQLVSRYRDHAADMPFPHDCPLCRADKRTRADNPALELCECCPWIIHTGTQCHVYRLQHRHLTAQQWAQLRLTQLSGWLAYYKEPTQ